MSCLSGCQETTVCALDQMERDLVRRQRRETPADGHGGVFTPTPTPPWLDMHRDPQWVTIPLGPLSRGGATDPEGSDTFSVRVRRRRGRATPPPCLSCVLAALVIASTSSRVTSAC